MRAILDGKTVEFEMGTAWKDLVEGQQALGVSVQGRTLSLATAAQDGVQAHVLTYHDEEGRRIYERTLQMVFLVAANRVIPGRRVRFEHSFGEGLFVRPAQDHGDAPACRAPGAGDARDCGGGYAHSHDGLHQGGGQRLLCRNRADGQAAPAALPQL